MKKLNKEEQAIHDVVKFYFEGAYYGDENKLRKAFHTNARIVGCINDQIFDWSLTEFVARVTATPTAADRKEKYDKEITFIDQTGNTAMVKAKVIAGGYVFTDYITLLK